MAMHPLDWPTIAAKHSFEVNSNQHDDSGKHPPEYNSGKVYRTKGQQSIAAGVSTSMATISSPNKLVIECSG